MKIFKVALLSCILATAASSAAAQAPAADCTPRNLGFDQKAVGWRHIPLSKLKRDTEYKLLQEEGRAIVRASANGSASFYAAMLKPPAAVPASISWRWRTAALVPGADNRDKSKEDASLRVIAAFDGDVASLPEAEQKRFKRAKSLSGRSLPYAMLMYIWSEQVPLNTVIPSAHTSQVKMLVVASGSEGLGRWQSVKRNLAEDYRLAFGVAPGRLLGVGVFTDTDNTNTKAVGDYAEIRLECSGV